MTNTTSLDTVISDLSTRARKEGAELEVSIGRSESFSASYQQRKLKKYSADQSQSAVFRVLYGKGTGLSTTENLEPEALVQAFDEALKSARDLNKSAAPDKMDPSLLDPMAVPEVPGLFHSDYSELSPEKKLAWAQELETRALDFDPRVTNVPYSGFSHSVAERALYNSRGMNLTSRSSSLSAYSYALAKEAEDSKSGLSATFQRNPSHFDARRLAEEAAKRSLELLGAGQPKTGKWNVVFTNEVAAELLGLILDHFSAKSLDEGTSLLKGKKGETVFSKKLSWTDDPFRPDLPASRPFDAEGAPSRTLSLVREGRLENYLTNSYYARKMNLPHTAHAVRGLGELDIGSTNILVEKGTLGFDNLVALAPEVLVINDVQAIHSGYKESTGDFSLPASGFIYRNGAREKPVHQFVVSGNLLDLLGRVSELSNAWNENGDSTLCPDLFVPDVSVAGQN